MLVHQFFSNPDKDETIVKTVAHFDGLVDHVAKLRNEGIHGSKEMRHVAEIPGAILDKYCQDNHIEWAELWADPKHIKAICNDPALAAFRVAPGKV